LIDFFVFNATFSNSSTISWRPVVVVHTIGDNNLAVLRFHVTLSIKSCKTKYSICFCWLQKILRVHVGAVAAVMV